MNNLIQIDVNSVVAVIISVLLSAAIGGLIHLVLSVKRLIWLIGTSSPPDGLMGKVFGMEVEIKSLREWALGQGYERRSKEQT